MRRFVPLVVVVAVLPVAAGVEGPATPAQPTVWNVVALGDSDATGEGDPTGLGWVGRYARLLRERHGLEVAVTNLAANGKTSDELLSQLRSDSRTRSLVKRAHVVLFGIGGADLNPGDVRNDAGTCKGEACYAADLRAFGRNLDRAAALVRTLRGSNKTVLRAVTLPDVVPGARDVIPPFITPAIGRYQTATLRRRICAAMATHGGRCVDVLRAFNGPDGTQNAYASGLLTKSPCCYPSGRGQQLMAQLVLKSGLAPIR